MHTYQTLLDRIVHFCKHCENVKALVLIGSQARKERQADAFSDLDLLLLVNDADSFFDTDAWLLEIGDHHISFIEQTLDGQRERRVLFDGALDVDFVILPSKHAPRLTQGADSIAVLRLGYKILVDKGGLSLPDASALQSTPYHAPTAEEYQNTVNDFWYHAVWTAKKLLRGELWTAKFCVDSYMKWKLLWMIEHYEHALHGIEYHTWYRGRFLDDWAEAPIKDALAKSFAPYNKQDMICALLHTMDLFRSLAMEVAERYHLPYPAHADAYGTQWVKRAVSTDW